MKKEKLSEAMIVDCYWMAHFYGVNPNEFLNQSAVAIRKHMKQSRTLYGRIFAERKNPLTVKNQRPPKKSKKVKGR